jgi:hypothetical protein
MFCEEELIVQKSFGKVCVNSMSLYSPTVQGYIYHDEIDQVSIFSPVNDTLRLKCSSTVVDKLLPVGITVFSLPSGCIAMSSQLIIFSKSSVWNEGTVPQIFDIDLSRDIDDLTRYIEEIHDVNFTVIEQDFKRYSQSVNNTRLDIAEVKKSLEDFKHINSIKEYSPLKIDWNDPYALSNVATISGLLATLLFLVVLVICCKCCSCCSFGTRLCKCAGKSCECCFKAVRKLSVRRADIPGDSNCGKDDISLSQRHNNNNSSEVMWEIEKIGERLVLFAELPSGLIYYNSALNLVENSEGYVLKGVQPPVDTVNRYWLEFGKLAPPSLVKDETIGKYCIRKQLEIVYEPESLQYIHSRTGKVMYGFKPPSGFSPDRGTL